MAIVTLTARYLDLLKPHRHRYEVFDTIVPGFAIRVTPSGHKSFTLYYRHHGRHRRIGLGGYPDVSLADARKDATEHRGRICDGKDPAAEKQTAHAQDDEMVQALYELYREHKEKTLKSWSEIRRIIEREVLPKSRHLRVVEGTPKPRLSQAMNGMLIVMLLTAQRRGEVSRMGEAGIRVVQTPYQAPNGNAYAERFVRSIKEECLDRLIPIGERHFQRAVTEYVAHYLHEQNHQGIENALIEGVPAASTVGPIRRRPRLGGVFNYYERAA